MNVGLLLEMIGSTAPDRVAVTADDGELTFGELTRASHALAERVSSAGAVAVLFCGPNSAALPVALFGAGLAGVPFVPLNYRLSAAQLESIISAYPKAMVVADSTVPGAAPNSVITCEELLSWTPVNESDERSPAEADDVAVILYTSGTSGAPKAALLRHRHLVSYVLGTVEFAGAEEAQAALVSVPPYHIAGIANLLSNLYSGRRVIYLKSFDPETWLEAVRRERATQAMLVPTMLARIVAHLGERKADVPTLQTLSYGGSRMPRPVIERALELFDVVGFVNAYGLTETSSTIALLDPEVHRAARAGDPLAIKRLGSVGRLLPGIEVEIRGDAGEVLPSGEAGLVFLRGDQVAGEYATGSVLDDAGWFSTRDRGTLDEEGYLFIEGRADDTIIRGGENIDPAEIEDVIGRLAGVSEVAVIGTPDDEWGQRIVAVIVKHEESDLTESDVRVFAREHLRSSKTPEVVVFRSDLPRTPTGKILRRELLVELSD